MFGIFKKKESQADQAQKQIDDTLKKMGASVLLITQSGKIVMVSDRLRSRPRDWLGGQAIEVMISHPSLDPYFIYYENEDYYFKMASNGSRVLIADFQKAQDAETYRNSASQALCMYLIFYLIRTQGKDIRHPQMSFSHNKIHTNVIAYVEKLNDWYPIQHAAGEPDSATERKVTQVNQGTIGITDVIAVHEPSPARTAQASNYLCEEDPQDNLPTIDSHSDIDKLVNELGFSRAFPIIEKCAEGGNKSCQISLSMLGLSISEDDRTDAINNRIEKFTKMAAQGGHVQSQFNLALFYSRRVNTSNDSFSEKDIEFLSKAKYWHERAASQGYAESERCLNALNSSQNIKMIPPKA